MAMKALASDTPRAKQRVRPGAIAVRSDVAFDAPWEWLGAGWRDLWAIPAVSLGYGATFALAALAMVMALMRFGGLSLVLVLAGGFLLVGPMLAAGLYELSRRLEAGEAVDARDAILVGMRSPGQLAIMGLVLMLAYLVWIEIALLLLMLFLGGGGLPPVEAFVPTLLFTSQGLGLLVCGTIAGGLLAAAVFAISALSIPLLMTHDVDVVTAVTASVRAVLANPKPMALWAALIAAMIGCGIATLLAGFVIAFPLIGHTTWHAFRDVIKVMPEPEAVPNAI